MSSRPQSAYHYTHPSLINPTNAILVRVIGAGGTGSQVMTALARMHVALIGLGHPGLQVELWDNDVVTEANLGRQLFAQGEVGLVKAVALINRINRFFGTNWKAATYLFTKAYFEEYPQTRLGSNIYISCVDTVKARFEIAELIEKASLSELNSVNRPYYWLDLGNSKETGQGVLSTVGIHKQPQLENQPSCTKLPFITEEFGELLRRSEKTDDTPSCSLAEALRKQDLFINTMIANMGCALLWSLFRKGKVKNRGFFLNLDDLTSRPIRIVSIPTHVCTPS